MRIAGRRSNGLEDPRGVKDFRTGGWKECELEREQMEVRSGDGGGLSGPRNGKM